MPHVTILVYPYTGRRQRPALSDSSVYYPDIVVPLLLSYSRGNVSPAKRQAFPELHSSVGTATGCGLRSRIMTSTSTGALSPAVKRSGCEAHHSYLISAKGEK
jgi:hypothetical protein